MKTILKLCPTEIWEIVKEHIIKEYPSLSEDREFKVSFDINPAYHSTDPRERNSDASFKGMTVEL